MQCKSQIYEKKSTKQRNRYCTKWQGAASGNSLLVACFSQFGRTKNSLWLKTLFLIQAVQFILNALVLGCTRGETSKFQTLPKHGFVGISHQIRCWLFFLPGLSDLNLTYTRDIKLIYLNIENELKAEVRKLGPVLVESTLYLPVHTHENLYAA